VKLEVGPSDCGDETRTDITMTIIHDCAMEPCPTFTGKVRFTVRSDYLEPFLMQLEARNSFQWLCSTPTFEGRIVVSRSTSRVANRTLVERKIH
jgi:hypothetical protein